MVDEVHVAGTVQMVDQRFSSTCRWFMKGGEMVETV